jgi:hypothetical protein
MTKGYCGNCKHWVKERGTQQYIWFCFNRASYYFFEEMPFNESCEKWIYQKDSLLSPIKRAAHASTT